jgi:hypothetical protein
MESNYDQKLGNINFIHKKNIWSIWKFDEQSNNIYLLTGYEGIASLLSPRHWLLTEAKPVSIVKVEGTTNLLFPNTQSYVIIPKNIRLIVEWSPQNDKDQ